METQLNTVVHIDDIAYGGKGVARLDDGKVCFVPGVLPGETVRIETGKDHGAFVDARPLELLAPSASRIVPVCPLAFRIQRSPFGGPCCPGCSYQHATYEEEVRLKHSQLCALLSRQAGCGPSVFQSPVPAPAPLGYRNKMSLHAQRDGHDVRLGYFAEDNQTVIDVPACPLATPELNARLAELRDNTSFRAGVRDGTTITFRWTAHDLAVWWRGEAATRETWLVESTLLGPLSVPRGSFFQVNPAVADRLLRHVIERFEADRPRTLVDLYCGVGLFALAAARAGVPEVIGADVDPEGMKAADYNARKLGLPGIRWMTGTAQKVLAAVGAANGGRDLTLVVDPPRSGLGRKMITDLLRHPPGRILYISCAPDTMSRDVAWLKEGGYEVENSRLFDMFPRTAHFESVTVLRRP